MKAPRLTEDQLQESLCIWLDYDAVWEGEYFAVPNGGKRAIKTAKMLKRTGVKPGVADLVFWGMPDCPLAFVELKRAKQPLSPAQIGFQVSAIKRKTPYEIIRGDDPKFFEDTMFGLLRGWGAMR